MASIRKEIVTRASPERAWDAIRDIGALHTRLVPGFVVDTRLEPGARVVTFGNGMVVKEPIVDLDDAARRLVWAAVGGPLTHYNASVQVFLGETGSRIVWIADLLPNEAAPIGAMIEQGAAVMKATLTAWATEALGHVFPTSIKMVTGPHAVIRRRVMAIFRALSGVAELAAVWKLELGRPEGLSKACPPR